MYKVFDTIKMLTIGRKLGYKYRGLSSALFFNFLWVYNCFEKVKKKKKIQGTRTWCHTLRPLILSPCSSPNFPNEPEKVPTTSQPKVPGRVGAASKTQQHPWPSTVFEKHTNIYRSRKTNLTRFSNCVQATQGKYLHEPNSSTSLTQFATGQWISFTPPPTRL